MVIRTIRMMMTCRWSARRIQRYLDADPAALLDVDDVRRLESHLATCRKCAEVAKDYGLINRSLARLSGVRAPEPEAVERLRGVVDRLVSDDTP